MTDNLKASELKLDTNAEVVPVLPAADLGDDFMNRISNVLNGNIPNVVSNELLNAQIEEAEEADEEKSEAEKSAEQPQPQTLEPTNQNVSVMLNVAEQAKGTTEKGSEQGNDVEGSQQSQNASADAGIPAKTGSEENPQQPLTVTQKAGDSILPELGDLNGAEGDSKPQQSSTGETPKAGEPAEQQQSIKDRLNKINSDAENLIRLRNADEIEGFILEEKFNDERYTQLINTQQSYISVLKKEVEILGCEKVVLLEQKERLEKKVSGYEEMCGKKNEEIKINNAKVRELNTRNSAILRLAQESVAEQIYCDSNFRNLLMAQYKKVGYKLKTLTADEQEVENKTQSELYDSTYNLYKNRQQDELNEVTALKTKLLALAGATETVKKEEDKKDVSRNVLD